MRRYTNKPSLLRMPPYPAGRGILRGSGLYTVLGRALWIDLPLARPSLRAHPDKPCSYQDDQGRSILRGVSRPFS
jgi:hypothetical protein